MREIPALLRNWLPYPIVSKDHSRTLSGGYASESIASTLWLWNLHADAHDYSSQLIPNTTVVSRLFATHFGHLSLVSAWFSAAFVGGARFSNYEQWALNPLNTQ